MLRLTVFLAFVGTIAAQLPFPDGSTTCAQVLCTRGSACREVYDPTRGDVQAQCLSPALVPFTNDVCSDGQTLLVNLRGQGLSQANCGLSINRIQCPSGYSCNIHPADAYAVCCPGPFTTPAPTQRPGECPAPSSLNCLRVRSCDDDASCPLDQKCCKSICGAKQCAAPVAVTPSCNNFPCPRGQKCILQTINCIRAPCPSGLPTCIPDTAPPQKDGQCPAIRPGEVGTCAFQCLSDAACAGTLKCCPTACGGTNCRSPVVTIVPPPIEREGVCPANVNLPFPARPNCRRFCQNDSDCPAIQKCCAGYSGCGAACQDPQPPRTCDNTRCRSDQKCVMVQVQCIRAPCFPQPTCIPRAQAVRCPFFAAFVDPSPQCQTPPDCNINNINSCGSGRVCCSTPCGVRCVNPDISTNN